MLIAIDLIAVCLYRSLLSITHPDLKFSGLLYFMHKCYTQAIPSPNKTIKLSTRHGIIGLTLYMGMQVVLEELEEDHLRKLLSFVTGFVLV